MKEILSSPISTGGGGTQFEFVVQASYVVLMLTGGYAPCLPCWPIKKIKLQGKIDGFETDDLIIFVENNIDKEERKLLAQIKRSISITKSSSIFSNVIQSAWKDFSNPNVFTKNKDAIALITGPLSINDTNHVQMILNQARFTNDVEEFLRNIYHSNFISNLSREKYEVFKHHLRNANGGIDVPDLKIYQFLRHFNILGYDLERESGVVSSLINSHISQFNKINTQQIWANCVFFTSQFDQNAGTISINNIPEEIRKIFEQPKISEIPQELINSPIISMDLDWNQFQYSSDLALVNLIGSWNENNDKDIAVLSNILQKDYPSWIKEAKEILQISNSPITKYNTQWKINNRENLWDSIGTRILDQDLDTFYNEAINVLSKKDVSFSIPQNEYYFLNRNNTEIIYSKSLRQGIAEGLAIMSSNTSVFTNCSFRKVENLVTLIIRNIFAEANWVLWGNLDLVLPDLAEASPSEFIKAVENTLQMNPCPFDELFALESSGIFGTNYITGLLWALEVIAWKEEYFIKICELLADLATHDPGGTSANRPKNSLMTILLPWRPQTNASFEKQRIAVRMLCSDFPEVGWALLLELISSRHQISTGSYKPRWRKGEFVPIEKKISYQNYLEQITFYSDLAITIAGNQPKKISDLITKLFEFPESSVNKLISTLGSENIKALSEKNREIIWNQLQRFTTKQRKRTKNKSALAEDVLSAIDDIERQLEPSNPLILYQYMFIYNDFELYKGKSNWEKQQIDLRDRRINAVSEIYKEGGLDNILEFIKLVESPSKVGLCFGLIEEIKIDEFIIPSFLVNKNEKVCKFANGFVLGRFQKMGWDWVDLFKLAVWSNEEKAEFLLSLPFNSDSWNRVSLWLKNSEDLYWSKTYANPYQADENLEIAIENFIKYRRPNAAIDCLYKMVLEKKQIKSELCIKALESLFELKEKISDFHSHEIVNLIQHLQMSPDVSQEKLAQIEWIYLRFLTIDNEVTPVTLENRMANDPEFFCELIRLMYRSKFEKYVGKDSSKVKESLAANAWHLMYDWKTPPGMQPNGLFDEEIFMNWLIKVKEKCSKSGHLEVALMEIGQVLIHSPNDPQGLWINKKVAEALNSRENERMREGFCLSLYNSRGVHWVDPTGKPEKDLANQYRQKAEVIENAGFIRLATSLRDLAKSYDQDAEMVIDEHSKNIEQ